MGRNSRKSDILDAASKVVDKHGIFNLTLDAVAKEAGLSKGGLLYHYPSKEALVRGMVDYLANNYEEKIAKDMEISPDEKGRFIRSYVNVTFNQSEANKQKNAVLLAAKAVDYDLLDPIRTLYEDWSEKIDNGDIDPMKAAIIQLATDGLWLTELFDINRMTEEKKKEIFEYLINWSKE